MLTKRKKIGWVIGELTTKNISFPKDDFFSKLYKYLYQ